MTPHTLYGYGAAALALPPIVLTIAEITASADIIWLVVTIWQRPFPPSTNV